MEITIQCVNFDKSESLNDYIAKKLTKLERFADIRTAEVTLRILHTSDKANKEIGVKLLAGDEEFYASRQTEVYEKKAPKLTFFIFFAKKNGVFFWDSEIISNFAPAKRKDVMLVGLRVQNFRSAC